MPLQPVLFYFPHIHSSGFHSARRANIAAGANGLDIRGGISKNSGHIRKFSLRHNLVIFLRNTYAFFISRFLRLIIFNLSYHNCKFINSSVLKLKFKYATKIIIQDIINFVFIKYPYELFCVQYYNNLLWKL